MKLLTAVVLVAAWMAPFTVSAQLAYASNEKDGTLSVIDTAKDDVVGTIPAGKTPRGMAASVDGQRLYVSDQKSNALRIIDRGRNFEYMPPKQKAQMERFYAMLPALTESPS